MHGVTAVSHRAGRTGPPAGHLALFLLVVCFGWPAWAEVDPKRVHLPAPASIPDLTQTDPKGEFAGGGKSFCGPVAVSNSFWAMFAADYRAREISQYALVNELASLSCMKTHVTKGTSVSQLMRGVESYLERRGEKNYYLKFQGWRAHDHRHRTGVPHPDLEWIKRIVSRDAGAVWLNVGWYRRDVEEGVLKRLGGHWVTAVGYGADEQGNPDPSFLVIHDPAPRAGPPGPEFVKMRKLEEGILQGVMRNLPRPAANLYLMEGGMHVKRGAHCAILDGAVGLVLRKKQKP